MGNRWLDRTGYDPLQGIAEAAPAPPKFNDPGLEENGHREVHNPRRFGEERTAERGLGGGRVNPEPTPKPDRRGLWRGFASGFPTFTNLVSALASLLAIVVALNFLKSQAIIRPEPVLADDFKPFGALKLERAPDAAAAHWIIEKYAVGASGLYFDWNEGRNQLGPAHFVFGTALDGRRSFYIPVPRPGWERLFERLQYVGFSGVKLYEIWPPAGWTSSHLNALQYKWAARCGVREEWIDWWSSFRSPDSVWLTTLWTDLPRTLGLTTSSRLRNECYPGGRCFIISAGCTGDAFEDIHLPMTE